MINVKTPICWALVVSGFIGIFVSGCVSLFFKPDSFNSEDAAERHRAVQSMTTQEDYINVLEIGRFLDVRQYVFGYVTNEAVLVRIAKNDSDPLQTQALGKLNHYEQLGEVFRATKNFTIALSVFRRFSDNHKYEAEHINYLVELLRRDLDQCQVMCFLEEIKGNTKLLNSVLIQELIAETYFRKGTSSDFRNKYRVKLIDNIAIRKGLAQIENFRDTLNETELLWAMRILEGDDESYAELALKAKDRLVRVQAAMHLTDFETLNLKKAVEVKPPRWRGLGRSATRGADDLGATGRAVRGRAASAFRDLSKI